MTSLARWIWLLARARCLFIAVAVLAAACDGPAPGADAGPADDASAQPDSRIVVYDAGGEVCETDDDCDDGVSCTDDACSAGRCRHGVNRAACDDGVFCNGIEVCDRTRGCLPAMMRETCNDQDVCTIDRCDESSDTCTHVPRDLDADGDPDFFCAGGGDCNDRDPAVSSLVNEVCSDGADNDCDTEIDELECGRPAHDLCEDALDVTGGGSFVLDTGGAMPDYSLSCGFFGDPDVVATFTLDAPRSVTVDAEADSGFFGVEAALRTGCDPTDTELACNSGYPDGTLRSRSLDPGEYTLLIATSTPGEVALNVTFGDPMDPPPNETCASPTDVSAGGTFTGSFVGVADDLSTSCGFGGQPDLVYTFTTTDEQDVQVSALSESGSLNWSIRSACGDETTDLRCAYGAPANGRIHQLPAGTYFLVLEGPTSSAPDFTMMVDFLAPTPAAHGDTCADPLPLTIGTPLTGTLVDKEDDIDLACSFFYRDAVHTFTIDEPSDVTMVFDNGGFGNLSVRSTCDDGASELVCESGSPARARLRNLAAGTYYVIGEAATPSGYTIQVDATTPPTVPDEVTGNDACPDAYDIPETGGLFHGTTAGLTNSYTAACGGGAASPDASFRLVLSESKHVVLATDGSGFDTVLHVHQDACTVAESYCDDDGGTGGTSLIDQVLPAGTWFVVVDGWGSGSSGQYLLDVTISDP